MVDEKSDGRLINSERDLLELLDSFRQSALLLSKMYHYTPEELELILKNDLLNKARQNPSLPPIRSPNLSQTLYTQEKQHHSSTNSLSVPASIFSLELSPLQTLVAFLHEVNRQEFKEIAHMINRSYRAVWGAYKQACSDSATTGVVWQNYFDCTYYVPVRSFNDKLSISESVVTYLKSTNGLRIADIARLLKKDQRTVWTVENRAKKKIGGGQV